MVKCDMNESETVACKNQFDHVEEKSALCNFDLFLMFVDVQKSFKFD